MKITIENFFSTALQNYQRIFIGLPDSYNTQHKYPVLYMQDGQNVFDLRYHNIHDWAVNRLFEELNTSWIIVAIESPTQPEKRFHQYYPWPVTGLERFLPPEDFPAGISLGGGAHNYADFLAKELIPYIESNFYTSQRRAIAGSSLGAIISLYTAAVFPIFEIIALLSPAIWFDRARFLDYCTQQDFTNQHIYFSIGTHETSNPNHPDFPQIYRQDADKLSKILSEKTASFVFETIDEGTHEGRSWHTAMRHFIQTYLSYTPEEIYSDTQNL
ncbi:MAG: alpha/beta hydrolase [Spirochaetia bacterium]